MPFCRTGIVCVFSLDQLDFSQTLVQMPSTPCTTFSDFWVADNVPI